MEKEGELWMEGIFYALDLVGRLDRDEDFLAAGGNHLSSCRLLSIRIFLLLEDS